MVDVIDKERQGLDPALQSLLDNALDDAGDNSASDKYLVYCAGCSHVLGRSQDAININGSHQHFCTNPHGIDFNVRCYSDALGCALSGQPTAADSWFFGFCWRFATCSGCNTHLGWLFENASAVHFYGLVRERIQIDRGAA